MEGGKVRARREVVAVARSLTAPTLTNARHEFTYGAHAPGSFKSNIPSVTAAGDA